MRGHGILTAGIEVLIGHRVGEHFLQRFIYEALLCFCRGGECQDELLMSLASGHGKVSLKMIRLNGSTEPGLP